LDSIGRRQDVRDCGKAAMAFRSQLGTFNINASGGESWQLLIAIQHSFCTVMYVLLSMWFRK